MIVGIGIDLIEIDRIAQAVNRQKRFAERVLTPEELDVFAQYHGHRQMEFLAGRFAAKEAFAKAMGTGIGKAVSFLDICILSDERGCPQVVKHPFVNGRVHVSIAHSKTMATAQIIIEQV